MVRSFIAVVLGFKFSSGVGIRKAVQTIKGAIQPEKQPVGSPELMTALRSGLLGLQASHWPDAVANFPATQLA